MRRDDRDDPFDDFFREIERMMNDVMGAGGDVRFDHGGSVGGSTGGDVHVDVHETDTTVRVVADMPGVEKESIDLKCDGSVLVLEASSDNRDFHERVRLPARVDEHSASASYNNGVLEVAFERSEDPRDIAVD